MTSNKPFNIWEGIYQSFNAADADATGPGFNGEVYRTRAIEAARTCLAALSARKPIPPFHKQRSTLLPPVAAMMLEDRDRLSVLDLGGGLGIGYMTLVESLPEAVEHIDYTVVEVPGICTVGHDLFEEMKIGGVKFVQALPQGGTYDLIHSASALQYVENWRKVIGMLSSYAAPYMLLSDVFSGDIPTFVTLQNYYGSRIKHWFLNLDELTEAITEIGYRVEMKSYVTSRRLGVDDALPMDNFPMRHRLEQTLHLLLRRIR